jgi:hypothetical protein
MAAASTAAAAMPSESTRLLSSGGAGGSSTQQEQMLRQVGGRLPFTAIAQPPQTQTQTQTRHSHAHPHHHHRPQEVEVDPVERMVKHALAATAAFLLLSFLGVLALVLKGLGFDRLPWLARLPPALHSYWAVFAPFWLADLVGLALVAEVFYGVCTLRATTRDEKRNIARCVRACVRGRGGGGRAHRSVLVVSACT